MAVATDLHRTFLILAKSLGESAMTAAMPRPTPNRVHRFCLCRIGDKPIIAHTGLLVKQKLPQIAVNLQNSITLAAHTHKMIARERNAPEAMKEESGMNMNNNCLGGFFGDNSCCWIIIIALIVLCCCCH